MPELEEENGFIGRRSPAGHYFGVEGWVWGPQRPVSITFFLDGSALVADQWGRPIRGAVGKDGKSYLFATSPPLANKEGVVRPRPELASHAQVIASLAEERVDWTKLTLAGWPQVPEEMLLHLKEFPPTAVEELVKIPDRKMRRAALKMRRKVDEERAKEAAAAESEEEKDVQPSAVVPNKS